MDVYSDKNYVLIFLILSPKNNKKIGTGRIIVSESHYNLAYKYTEATHSTVLLRKR
jgi:hypothetical protein